MIGPVFDLLSEKFPSLLFFKVDVDNCQARAVRKPLASHSLTRRRACLPSAASPRCRPFRRVPVSAEAPLSNAPVRELTRCAQVWKDNAKVEEMVGANKTQLEALIAKYA